HLAPRGRSGALRSRLAARGRQAKEGAERPRHQVNSSFPPKASCGTSLGNVHNGRTGRPAMEIRVTHSPRPLRRRRTAILVASLLPLALADGARASSVLCSTLGAGHQFAVLGSKKITATPGSPAGDLEGRPPETGPMCSQKETLTVASVGAVSGSSLLGDVV